MDARDRQRREPKREKHQSLEGAVKLPIGTVGSAVIALLDQDGTSGGCVITDAPADKIREIKL